MPKPLLVAYTHAPVSPGVQGLHLMLFKTLEAFEDQYDVAVLFRNKVSYEFCQKRFSSEHPHFQLLKPTESFAEGRYTLGIAEASLRKQLSGRKIAKVFWFSSGLKAFTSESKIEQAFKASSMGSLEAYSISAADIYEADALREGELLAAVIKDSPSFVWRVIDYLEADIQKATGWPMKLLSFHDDNARGHQKIHDTEWFHFSEKLLQQEKKYDFVFGYTVEIPERAYLSDFCFSHIQQNSKFKLYVKDKHFSKWSPIDTQLPTDEYFQKVSQAKFSLIAPSTEPTELSLNRVYEDIARGCIPLFMKDVQYSKALSSKLSDLISKHLVYDESKFSTVNEMVSKLDYSSLMQQINVIVEEEGFTKESLKQKLLKEIE